MKIDVNFSKLERCVHMMGTEPIEFDLNTIWPQSNFDLDAELLQGIRVNFDRIKTDTGLISTGGRQVLLYIPNHADLDKVLLDGNKGNKFHVADCKKLNEMREKDSLDRYIVTADLSGQFRVYKSDTSEKEATPKYANLSVCGYCLSYLNYKGYANCERIERKQIVESFKLDEFFSMFSSMFEYLPREQFKHRHEGYPPDWKEISKIYRRKMKFTCENCGVNLTTKKGLLHAHHNKRIKSRCLPQDLKALCLDCHRKEPFHQHMGIKRSDMDTINKLRREQGVSDPSDWDSIRKWVDPALFGFVEMCESSGIELPYVQFNALDTETQKEYYFDMAWPKRRVAVYIGDKPSLERWRILSFKEAHDVISDKVVLKKFQDYMLR